MSIDDYSIAELEAALKKKRTKVSKNYVRDHITSNHDDYNELINDIIVMFTNFIVSTESNTLNAFNANLIHEGVNATNMMTALNASNMSYNVAVRFESCLRIVSVIADRLLLDNERANLFKRNLFLN